MDQRQRQKQKRHQPQKQQPQKQQPQQVEQHKIAPSSNSSCSNSKCNSNSNSSFGKLHHNHLYDRNHKQQWQLQRQHQQQQQQQHQQQQRRERLYHQNHRISAFKYRHDDNEGRKNNSSSATLVMGRNASRSTSTSTSACTYTKSQMNMNKVNWISIISLVTIAMTALIFSYMDMNMNMNVNSNTDLDGIHNVYNHNHDYNPVYDNVNTRKGTRTRTGTGINYLQMNTHRNEHGNSYDVLLPLKGNSRSLTVNGGADDDDDDDDDLYGLHGTGGFIVDDGADDDDDDHYGFQRTKRLSKTNNQRQQNDSNTDCPEGTTTDPSSGWVTSIPKGLQYTLITVLILFSAFFSGLTLSMMGLDTTGLEIVMSGDDEELSRAAAKIYPVRKNGNLLLCTLLLGNVAVNTLLGILMAEITGGTVGFLTSTGLIVIFGEILPQALFSRYALQVGERAVPVVKVIMVILYIIAKPLAYCLDKLLGHELGTTYSKAEMSKLLEIHVKEGRFNQEVGTAMKGALQYQDMIVKEVMTPLENTFMISVDDRLTFETMATIFKTGYSRIPVYESSVGNVIGLLFVKDLIFIDPEDATPVRNLMQIFGRSMHFVWPDDKLGDVLRHLKSGHTHMALVRNVSNEDETLDPYYTLEGIITLEDIIEVILGEEIVDETDAWVDADHTKKVKRESAFDWSRLRLLDAKIVDETLSEDEVRVVAAHLRQNYSSTVENISDKQLMRMIAATAVTELKEVQKDAGESLPISTKLLYEKNKKSSICTLVLQGKVTVLAGNDNFRSDISSWSILATDALTDVSYTPDFSAYVSSGPCRCLQFQREVFAAACDASTLEKLPKKGLDDDSRINELTVGSNVGMSNGDQTGNSVRFTSDMMLKASNSSDQAVSIAAGIVPQSDQKSSMPASSAHSKPEDIVERSEHRGRLLATLLGYTKNEENSE